MMIPPRNQTAAQRRPRTAGGDPPGGLDLDEVRKHLESVPRVVAVHDLHASTVSTGLPILMAHVVVENGLTMEDGAAILKQLQDCLREHFPRVPCRTPPSNSNRRGLRLPPPPARCIADRLLSKPARLAQAACKARSSAIPGKPHPMPDRSPRCCATADQFPAFSSNRPDIAPHTAKQHDMRRVRIQRNGTMAEHNEKAAEIHETGRHLGGIRSCYRKALSGE